MNEEETKRKAEEEAKASAEQSAAGDKPEGDKPKKLTLYEQTNASAERVEIATEKLKEQLDRQEKLYEIQKLSGEGGGHVDTEPKELGPGDALKQVRKDMAEGKNIKLF